MTSKQDHMHPFKILSIDGGGTRGIIPATLLHRIFLETGQSPADIFGLLTGTSTGGILCSGYAYGIPTDEMIHLYLNKAREIFYDPWWDDLRDGFGKTIGADYSNFRFKKILKAVFGNTTLGDIRTRNKDRKGRLMVCCFDLNPKKNGKPINFRPRIYHSDFIRDQNVKLVDLCLMTSAGPTYFPIYKNHVDGGVSLNNPSMAALTYAINKQNDGTGEYSHPDGKAKGLAKTLGEIKILSLGCGTSNQNRIPPEVIRMKDNGDWGNLQWMKYLPDMLTESNMQASEYYVNQLLGKDQYKRIQLNFDHPEAPKVIRGKVLGIDVKNDLYLKAMVEYANDFFDKRKEEILKFLDLLPNSRKETPGIPLS